MTAEEAMECLQAAGVPAGAIKNPGDIMEDPQLRHRGYYMESSHPEIGDVYCPSNGFILSESKAPMARSPLLGEHTREVCCEILGISEDDFVDLMVDGALQ